jgi:uncharacterized protein YciI
MLYLVYCTDTAEGTRRRAEQTEPHRAHVRAHAAHLRLAANCPATEGETRQASLLVIEGNSVEEVRAIVEADPYNMAGAWETVVVRPVTALAGSWLPKKD